MFNWLWSTESLGDVESSIDLTNGRNFGTLLRGLIFYTPSSAYYIGVRSRAALYLGIKSDAQIYLGAKSLF